MPQSALNAFHSQDYVYDETSKYITVPALIVACDSSNHHRNQEKDKKNVEW